MILSLTSTLLLSPSTPFLKPPSHPNLHTFRKHPNKRNNLICTADLSHDAPFAVAIGACVFTSLISPTLSPSRDDDEDEDDAGSAIDSTDARFAVMGIISFIPYFNWMSWVFAWLDTRRQRYLVYAVVYLAPYLRTNLSLSPEDSWLPITSILVCILHIQLEASIRNGDLDDIQFFGGALNFFSQFTSKKDTETQSRHGFPPKGRSNKQELPSASNTRARLREWRVPREPVDDVHHLNENSDANEKENKSD